MIKKLHEEWEKASQEARQVADQDPQRHQEILERMSAVGGALRKLSQGSVTRTTLSQAVREALAEILKNEKDRFFPDLAAVRDRIDDLGTHLGREIETARARSGLLEARLCSVEEALAGELPGRAAALESDLGGLRELGERIEAELSSLRSLAGDLERKLTARVEGLREESASRAGAVAGEVERRIEDLVQSLDRRDAEIGGQLGALRDRGGGFEVELNLLKSLAAGLEKELSAGLDRAAVDLAGRAGDLQARIEAEAARHEALRRDLESADDHLAEGLKELEGRLAGRTADLESTTASRLDGLEGSLRQSLAAAETRLVEAQGQLDARFTSSVQAMASRIGREQAERILKIEASLPEVRALEERLRSQMGIIMEQLEDKVDGLVSMVSQIKTGLPPRELFQALDERLMRIESRFRTVSDQLDALEGAVAEGKALAEQVSQVRGEVVGLATEFSTSEKGLRDAWDLFARRLQDLQDLLRTGVDRWEADRSGLRQRLVDLRDTLRDGLQSAAQRAEGAPGSFWSKMLARPDGGLRLGSEEWDRLRTRLETILQGLEGLLVESK